MVLGRFFGRDPLKEPARALYESVVLQARQPMFYDRCGVPDSVDGRFDLIVLHAFLVMNRLKKEPQRSSNLSQALFDLLFMDMDLSLREMGVGDVGVGTRIKTMVQAFYGRISAYESGLKEGDAALKAALERNLFGTTEASPAQLDAIAVYAKTVAAELAGQDMEQLLQGHVVFPALPEDLPGSGTAA
ncbi:ubiquinol-cytochrome C chaperone family protein [Denitrobaculum tricleocarpae]|uniref:Ubiquinol-cytochrome c chaperone domain-containing protein n=1 Tax=Denitrobaculum tricleocarpae TaxID=2591009 RepID=A0A545TTC8_9PROT|nr:ubiquinol-cytochrome C chaperone family protein [Denitrobaculum tricleocarpae]TQV80474.1 hypothetical protein FKG95_09865 [Denitrobaculum tricleocarpae]